MPSTRIAVLMQDSDPSAAFWVAAKKATGCPLSVLKQRAEEGIPIWEPELWLDDHEEVASSLRLLMSAVAADSVRVSYLVLEFDRAWDDKRNPEIDAARVRNLLHQRDARINMRRQETLG